MAYFKLRIEVNKRIIIKMINNFFEYSVSSSDFRKFYIDFEKIDCKIENCIENRPMTKEFS